MNFSRDDYVKVLTTNGKYRYGYVSKTSDNGWVIVVDMRDEGASKIAWDTAADIWLGRAPTDWDKELTDTEKKIIPLLAANLATGGISEILGIAPVTVRYHVRNLRIKFHLDNRTQLIAYCQGLITLQGESTRLVST